MRKIFLDSDGVLADWDFRAKELLGCDPRSLPDDVMWQRLNQFDDFWHTIPKRYDADFLVNSILEMGHIPAIITGCPKSNYEIADKGKREFFKMHWPELVVNTCLARNKSDFMQNKGDILIDDFKSNCKRWEKAGGIAIWHRRSTETLEQLIKILEQGV
jgi:hypothetical protein